MKKRKFTHGQQVKDQITKFTGIITGYSDYITGCDQYLVQPPTKDGEYKEGRWFDEGKLVLVDGGAHIEPELVMASENGCDASAPIKN